MKTIERKDWNLLIGAGVLQSDRELFFGPLEADEEFITLPDETTMPDILALANVFPSRNQARKNGWGEDRVATFAWNARKFCDLPLEPGIVVPNGFTDFRAGKGKAIRITILKIL